MRRLAASAAALAVTLGVAAAVPTTSAEAGTAGTRATSARAVAAAYAPPPVDWKKCKDPYLKSQGAQCGTLVVPLDHANPTGPTIKLAVSRVKATRKPYRGAIFTNPGGPGGAGIFLSTYGQYVPDRQGSNYDWYGMDPRGVGSSRPALSCDAKYFKWDREPYRPTTAGIESYWLARTEKYAASCGTSKAAALLPHLKTADNVADFELLRQAIGQTQITFYGFSYGTYIAELYATLHPASLKAMILDGVIDSSRVWYQSNIDQDHAFEKTFQAFFKWVGKYPGLYGMGSGGKAVRKAYEKLQKKLDKNPAGGKIGPAELDDAVLGAGYFVLGWPDIAAALADLKGGDPRAVMDLYRSGNPVGKRADNGYAMYLATICSEAPWPSDYAVWKTDMTAVDQASPFYTWANAWFNMPCRTWPTADATQSPTVTGTYTGPVLLLSETFDAATPFAGALATRALFPNSALVEGVGGTSHAVSLFGIACTDDPIATLLKSGDLPRRKAGNRADKRCDPLPPPDPTVEGLRSAVRPHPYRVG